MFERTIGRASTQWCRLGVWATLGGALLLSGGAVAACRIADFSNATIASLSEIERLAYVTQMRGTEFSRLKALQPGDPNYYAVVAASAVVMQAKQQAQAVIDTLGLANGADYAKGVWATNHLDDKGLQAYTLCLAKEDVGVWIRARQARPGVFTMAFAHGRPIGVWPLETVLIGTVNIKNNAQLAKYLSALGARDEINESFELTLEDRQKPASVTLQFGAERPKTLYIPLFPLPQVMLPASIIAAAKSGAVFHECKDVCPEMVSLPAGSFMMGTPRGEDESNNVTPTSVGKSLPVHKVDIGPGLAISKYPVTVAQYAAFVKDTGYKASDHCHTPHTVGKLWVYEDEAGFSWQNPGMSHLPHQDNFPVVCVTWDDAKAYTDWLSRKTGSNYRLPSEAEFEYAARAGTTTAYFWGDDPNRTEACAYSNQPDLAYAKEWDGDKVLGVHYRFQCDDGYAWSSPVGHYKPNSWGLYDMLGNVWQWTEDCWSDNYVGAPTDGSARTTGDCDVHVMRGGSSGNAAWYARAGNRAQTLTEYAGHSFGFRVARK